MSERDFLNIERNTCWRWQSYIKPSGYGQTQKNKQAHRVMYELLVGPIQTGLVLDHLCRNRACVNPHHLEPVTIRMNLMRSDYGAAAKAMQSHCIHGHPLSGENLYVTRTGQRKCRTCRRDALRRFHESWDGEYLRIWRNRRK